MAPLFQPVREIARRKAWRIAAGLLAAGAILLGFVPLLSTAGMEWSLAFAVPAALVAGFTGIALARAARGRALDPLALWVAGIPLTLGPLIAPLAIAYLHGLHVRNCTPAQTALFWLLGPVASALYASAIGLGLGRVATRRGLAPGILVAMVVFSLAATGLGILAGPTQFASNHFLGWIPGPIYDQAAGIAPGLWYLRFLSLLVAALALLSAGCIGERLPGLRARAASLAVVAAVLLVALHFRASFKIDLSTADIRERALNGTLHTAHFDIYYATSSTDPARLDLIARDHEFRLAQVCAFLGVPLPKHITSWFYPSAASKKEWTGAGGTQVANPWKKEIYVNDDGWPHPVLQHELTHVVASQFGIPIFGISVHHGVLPNIGLIEGIAVASAWHDDGTGTPHEESAAMMRANLLPDPVSFLGLGFWGGRGAVNYTAAGSFVRFLADTYGIDRVRRAYAWSDFDGAFGKSVPALADEWRAFLTTVPVPPKRAAAARETFTRPSIFERTCARELALLQEKGSEAAAEGQLDRALEIYRRWAAVDDRPDPLWYILSIHRAKNDLSAARALAAKITGREIPDSPGWWNATMNEADLRWLAGDAASARDTYAEVFSAHVTSDIDRQAWVKKTAAGIAMSDDPAKHALGEALRQWLQPAPGMPHEANLAALVAAAEQSRVPAGVPEFVAAYLLGRNLLRAGAPAAAIPWLEACATAMRGGAASDAVAIRAEVFSMLGDARLRTGRYTDAAAAWDAMRDAPGAAGDVRDRAMDGAERTAWSAAHDARGNPL